MQKNNCTILELKEKLKEVTKSKNLNCLDEESFIDYGIYHESRSFDIFGSSKKTFYFICSDGVGMIRFNHRNPMTGRFYLDTDDIDDLQPLDEKELEIVAIEYHQAKEKFQSMDQILQSQKLRGFFLKLKTKG